jgi:hypothetical protein
MMASQKKLDHCQKEDQKWPSHLVSPLSDSFKSSFPRPTCPSAQSELKRVRFENRIRVREVRHRNDMSAEMITSMWLTMDDYRATKEVLKKTVRLIMANEIIHEDYDGLCARGLEGRTRVGSAHRVRKKAAIKKIVLIEQQRQRQAGIIDHEKIASVCSTWSKQCSLDARMMAMQDARDAR